MMMVGEYIRIVGTTAAVPGWQALFTAKRKGWRVLPVICWATVRRYFDVKVHGLPDTENFVSPLSLIHI